MFHLQNKNSCLRNSVVIAHQVSSWTDLHFQDLWLQRGWRRVISMTHLGKCRAVSVFSTNFSSILKACIILLTVNMLCTLWHGTRHNTFLFFILNAPYQITIYILLTCLYVLQSIWCTSASSVKFSGLDSGSCCYGACHTTWRDSSGDEMSIHIQILWW